MIKSQYIDYFYGFLWWCPKVYNEFKEHEEKIQLQDIQGREIRPKAYLAITFWAILLMISFEDLILIFYIWVPNTTVKGTMN